MMAAGRPIGGHGSGYKSGTTGSVEQDVSRASWNDIDMDLTRTAAASRSSST
jgi:hypothetical protein